MTSPFVPHNIKFLAIQNLGCPRYYNASCISASNIVDSNLSHWHTDFVFPLRCLKLSAIHLPGTNNDVFFPSLVSCLLYNTKPYLLS